MIRYPIVLFDLDGTLLDTHRDLAASTNHVRAAFGLPPLAVKDVERLVGHGARVLVERALGAERAAFFDEGVRLFLVHYGEHCLDATLPYPGIVDLVDSLRPLGARVAVLTNKPERLTRKILEGLGLLGRMSAVVGGDTFRERKPHPRGAAHILEVCGARPEDALVVGDSPVDVETARAAKTAFCGVLWGFDPDGLRATGAEPLVRDAAELERVIRSGSR